MRRLLLCLLALAVPLSVSLRADFTYSGAEMEFSGGTVTASDYVLGPDVALNIDLEELGWVWDEETGTWIPPETYADGSVWFTYSEGEGYLKVEGGHLIFVIGSNDEEAPSDDTNSTSSGAYLPADNNPADHHVSDEEFDAYCAAWQAGEDWPEHGGLIPIDFVTRTAWIYWEYDGDYTTNTNTDPNSSGSYQGVYAETTDWDSVWNNLNFTAIGGTIVDWTATRVLCNFDLPEGATACAIELSLPEGWVALPEGDGGLSVISLNEITTGTVNAQQHTVRWGPYRTSEIPTNIGTFLISMNGDVLPETDDLDGIASFDGTDTALTSYELVEPSLYVYCNTDEAAGRDPALHAGGALLEKALAGRGNRPSEDFSPVFKPFINDEGQLSMRCTLTRDVIYPEMGFVIERKTSLGSTEWDEVPVEWTLIEQDGRKLVFETTFACLDSGQPEYHRVRVTENAEVAVSLPRTFE
ncbi:hypothetical protein [Ruficoccus sp. ZRK36]|uniref:hypothetical protein n=1 Tax=Ruficoccus sp. ZRK36 TaxID=2866311 RepID=UPI001C72EB45|nr:hypothetical protein [Ruficoccus sp. ZRK36]QYY36026.1 hypothetical protein K0V07_00820 [Ruficoccus sp. ZRK36]